MRKSAILLVRPSVFFMNNETAVDNFYQNHDEKVTRNQSLMQVVKEFDHFAQLLSERDIETVVLHDTNDHETPDAIYPNNWFSTTDDGKLFLYPMASANRRLERRPDLTDILRDKGFIIREVYDLTSSEEEGLFLEGTGSLVIDPLTRNVFAAISGRTHRPLVETWCKINDRQPFIFQASHGKKWGNAPIYHTNVILSLGRNIAIWTPDAIPDPLERHALRQNILHPDRVLIEISMEQANHFCGNALEICNDKETFLVMSTQAYNHFTRKQIEEIKRRAVILHAPLTTVETFGGGSARCMMAEVFLPRQSR